MFYFISVLITLFIFSCSSENNSSYSVTSEPLHSEQWAIVYDQEFYAENNIQNNAHINAEKALAKYAGNGVNVVIIDTGINISHIELKHINALDAKTGASYTQCINNCTHGGRVTGILAAAINNQGLRGLLPNANIWFLDLDLTRMTSDSEFIAAFELAESLNADVILCSWGTGDVSPVIAAKLTAIANTGRNGKGSVIVFATGNGNSLLSNDESLLPSVLGVGASDEGNLRAYYSNFGHGIDVLAPGGYNVGITTISDDGNNYLLANDSDKFFGSSASAVFVAALAAMLIEKEPDISREQIFSTITNTSDKIGNVAYINGYNQYYGYGKINFDKALGNE